MLPACTDSWKLAVTASLFNADVCKTADVCIECMLVPPDCNKAICLKQKRAIFFGKNLARKKEY